VTNLKDLTSEALKILLVGPSGTGKTILATTLGERCQLLDLNRGLGSAATLQDQFQTQRGLCDVKKCWGGSPADVWKRTLSFVNSYAAKPARPALVIDGLSDLLEASLGEVLGAGYAAGAKMTQPMWGVAISAVQRIMWTLASVNAVVVVVAHTQRITVDYKLQSDGSAKKLDDDEERMVEVLAVYGKALPQKIPALFDEIWCLRTVGGKRLLQTQPSEYTECCKTRYQLPDRTDASLGMPRLLEMIGWRWPVPVAGPPVPPPLAAVLVTKGVTK
jgi:hypothetical protein